MPKISEKVSLLDIEYLQILRKMKPYIASIINTHYISLIKQWLERLSDEKFSDKELRNTYLLRLGKQVEEGVLDFPFTDPPENVKLTRFFDSGNGQGDQPPAKSPPEDNSWLDVSESRSDLGSASDDVNPQGAVISKLKFENNELMKIINKNDNHLEINETLNAKVVELQKQLANAMHRNVELQKTLQLVQDQREQFIKETEDFQKKEVKLLQEKYAQSLQEHETALKQDAELKYAEFSKKINSLQEWYTALIAKNDGNVLEKCKSYDKEMADLKSNYSMEQAKLIEKQKEDAEKIRDQELKINQMEEDFRKHLADQEKQNAQQLADVKTIAKQKYEEVVAHYKKILEAKRGKYHQHLSEQMNEHEHQLQKLTENHQSTTEEQSKIIKECTRKYQQLKDLNKTLHKEIEQVGKEKQALAEEIDSLRAQLKYRQENDLSEKYSLLQKDFEEQRANHALRLDEQELAHQKLMNDLIAKHADRLTKQANEHLEAFEKEKNEHEMALERLKTTYEKQTAWLQTSFQKQLNNAQLAGERHGRNKQFSGEIDAFLIDSFDDNVKAIDLQEQDNYKFEMLLREECVRLYTDIRELRADKARCLDDIDRLQEEIAKVRERKCRQKREFQDKMHKLALFYKERERRFKILRDSEISKPNGKYMNEIDQIVLNLEGKYKAMVLEINANALKDLEKYQKKIAELETRLGISLMTKVRNAAIKG